MEDHESEHSLLDQLRALLPGTIIPKPRAVDDFKIRGWGKRNSEIALIYLIPNHNNPDRPYQKGVTAGEWQQAYRRLTSAEEFTREWFKANMPRCASEGSCNFTSIGGTLSPLGHAHYDGRALTAARRIKGKTNRSKTTLSCYNHLTHGRKRESTRTRIHTWTN